MFGSAVKTLYVFESGILCEIPNYFSVTTAIFIRIFGLINIIVVSVLSFVQFVVTKKFI